MKELLDGIVTMDSNKAPDVHIVGLECGHTRTVIGHPAMPIALLIELMSETDIPCEICRAIREQQARQN